MLEQAAERTADISLGDVSVAYGTLHAKVSVTSKTGHKFPSGVGFRRAFIELVALDATGTVVWGSGRTDGSGRIVDASGQPLPGEVWWKDDCSARLDPGNSRYEPHFQTIAREDEAHRVLRMRRLERGPLLLVDDVVRWSAARAQVGTVGIADPREREEFRHRGRSRLGV
jgi:hypothetical protein